MPKTSITPATLPNLPKIETEIKIGEEDAKIRRDVQSIVGKVPHYLTSKLEAKKALYWKKNHKPKDVAPRGFVKKSGPATIKKNALMELFGL